MVLYRNLEVEERQPELESVTLDFLADTLQYPVSETIPNTPLAHATQGYVVHHLSRDKCVLPAAHVERRREVRDFLRQNREVRDFLRQPVETLDRRALWLLLKEARVAKNCESSLFMQALHAAFSEHVPFSLSPEVAWYLIAHEAAIHIRQQADRYRGYFTSSLEKGALEIRDDSLVYGSPNNQWDRTIDQFRAPLTENVPVATIEMFLPKFSTASFESEIALLVLFLDVASNYYELVVWTLCGIPAVRVEGSAEDWRAVVRHAEQLQHEFAALKPYFDDLVPVLTEIAATAAGAEPDPEFWNSIYKFNNWSGGSGITGWITAFIAHRLSHTGEYVLRNDLNWRQIANRAFDGLTTTALATHLSIVPFVWNYYRLKLPMAFIAGVMGLDYDGFLTPRLGYGVLQDARAALNQ